MTPDPQPTRVASPCIKVCTLDALNVCVGCGRTLDEIAAWSRLSPQEQLAVCERAAHRREEQARREQQLQR